MQMTININGYPNVERHVNYMLKIMGPGREITNVSFTESGNITFEFSEHRIGKSFCRAFSRTHQVTRITKRDGKEKVKEVVRGYDSLEDVKKKCRRGLTKKRFRVVKELEHENGWLIFYTL